MQAMQVGEALENADEWIKGVTLYEGARGWRVACATLAAEVRRLRRLVMCGCGDIFTEHDPCTCGNCLAVMDRTAEVERLRKMIGNAPVAIMDTRDVLGICAPEEDDFPALYALQGHRIALVDLGPNV